MTPCSADANPDAVAFDRGTLPFLRTISGEDARKLLEYRVAESLRKRIDELADKCQADTLSDSERLEYEGYVRANKFVAVLQVQVSKALLTRGIE